MILKPPPVGLSTAPPHPSWNAPDNGVPLIITWSRVDSPCAAEHVTATVTVVPALLLIEEIAIGVLNPLHPEKPVIPKPV